MKKKMQGHGTYFNFFNFSPICYLKENQCLKCSCIFPLFSIYIKKNNFISSAQIIFLDNFDKQKVILLPLSVSFKEKPSYFRFILDALARSVLYPVKNWNLVKYNGWNPFNKVYVIPFIFCKNMECRILEMLINYSISVNTNSLYWNFHMLQE